MRRLIEALVIGSITTALLLVSSLAILSVVGIMVYLVELASGSYEVGSAAGVCIGVWLVIVVMAYVHGGFEEELK